MTNENKPETTAEAEEWVTQCVVPRRVAIDEYRWITKHGYASSWGMILLSPKDREELSHGHIDEYGARLEVRCKRKDFPVDGFSVSVNADGTEKYEPIGRTCVVPKLVSQDELNAAPKTRAWTFGKPAQTGHFLLSYKDPAFEPQEIFANTINCEYRGSAIWFLHLGQTSDFVDPVVPKAKYTLLLDPREPKSIWRKEPEKIQALLDAGWTIVKEQEYEIPEWDR